MIKKIKEYFKKAETLEKGNIITYGKIPNSEKITEDFKKYKPESCLHYPGLITTIDAINFNGHQIALKEDIERWDSM